MLACPGSIGASADPGGSLWGELQGETHWPHWVGVSEELTSLSPVVKE